MVPLEGNNFNQKTFGLSNEVSQPYLSLSLYQTERIEGNHLFVHLFFSYLTFCLFLNFYILC